MTFVCAAGTKGPWWIMQTSGLDTNLRAVAVGEYQEPQHAPVPVIWASGSNGVILQSKDEGKTWKQFHILGAEKLDFRGIRVFDAQEAYVMSSGDGDKSRIYRTTDGGRTGNWNIRDSARKFFWTRWLATVPRQSAWR